MVTWNNLDKLASFEELKKVERVNLAEVMSGENGAERVKSYSVPMAEGLAYNYAAKQVNEDVLAALVKLAEEAQLSEKFEELYNGAVINTGENRMVLHHLARKQLGNPVVVDGVDKREFYVAQQKKAADFANKVHAGESRSDISDANLSALRQILRSQYLPAASDSVHMRTGLPESGILYQKRLHFQVHVLRNLSGLHL